MGVYMSKRDDITNKEINIWIEILTLAFDEMEKEVNNNKANTEYAVWSNEGEKIFKIKIWDEKDGNQLLEYKFEVFDNKKELTGKEYSEGRAETVEYAVRAKIRDYTMEKVLINLNGLPKNKNNRVDNDIVKDGIKNHINNFLIQARKKKNKRS